MANASIDAMRDGGYDVSLLFGIDNFSDRLGYVRAYPNEQHYEVPPGFFEIALGPRLKYSAGFFPGGDETLAEGEERMLEITCERADLADGQRILELGCGWGSLTLWMAEHYPNAEIVAVSNSAPQRRFILARAAAKGLGNLTVLTADMNGFDAVEATGARFDRVVSVEMFEHMRNYDALFANRPQGSFIPFLMLGDPDLETSLELLLALVDAGGGLAIATNNNPGSAPCHSVPMAMALAVRSTSYGTRINSTRTAFPSADSTT